MKFLFLLAFLILQLTFIATQCDAQTAKEYIKSGNQLIAVYDFDGLDSLLNQKNDTTYVVNFWATWCIPCVQELPYFEQLLEKYGSEKMKLLLVSLDFRKKVDQSLIPFMAKKKLKSTVVLLDDKNANIWINKVDSTWSGALPATLILNKNQRLFFEKSFTFEELETEYLNSKK